jgi:hypothetical protein
VGESNLLIRVTLRAILRGVSIWYLAWPVASSMRVVRRGESLENRSVQPLIVIWWGVIHKDRLWSYQSGLYEAFGNLGPGFVNKCISFSSDLRKSARVGCWGF